MGRQTYFELILFFPCYQIERFIYLYVIQYGILYALIAVRIFVEQSGEQMNTQTISQKKEKVNFLFPHELNRKATDTAKELGFSYSDLVRQALAEFLERFERNRIEREIVEASKHFYEIEKKVADEWRITETDF